MNTAAIGKFLVLVLLAAGAGVVRPAPAWAAESYDNCTGFITSLPTTIATQGVWCLDRDLSTAISSGNAITVTTNNVTIECNHFKIGGLAAGPGTSAFGIRAIARLNTTVRNCNLRGFVTAVYLVGAGHLVEGSRFDGNTFSGIHLEGPGSMARNNLVLDTGGSTMDLGFAAGIWAEYGTDVVDNSISGVAGSGVNAGVAGIYTAHNGEGSVIGNRLRGLVASGTGFTRGIQNVGDSGRTAIRDNTIQGPGAGTGITCNSTQGSAQNNVIAGFPTGIQNCDASSNVVNPN